jgi:pimeloyl-ACP methyl ester carboxylesterase
MSRLGWILTILLVMGLTVGAPIYALYWRDLDAARERVEVGGSIVETACGAIEHAIFGKGPPVLMVHGAGGGYDQGLLFASLIGGEFTWIVPSRFGYLGTPLPEDPTVEGQADAHACLLDALGIGRVGVVGTSAGGPSSLQFALRNPERCSALVMISAVSQADPPRPFFTDLALGLMLTTDLPYWLMMTAARPTLISVLGVTGEAQARLSPEDAEFVSEALEAMLPVSLRRDGILFDMTLPDAVNNYPLDQIAAPTLVVHATDDALVPFHHAEHTASAIPGARTMFLPGGGHFGYTFRTSAPSDVAAFLSAAVETTGTP